VFAQPMTQRLRTDREALGSSHLLRHLIASLRL
jgi:hypothetical protein